MSDTPRTDAELARVGNDFAGAAAIMLCRDFEREITKLVNEEYETRAAIQHHINCCEIPWYDKMPDSLPEAVLFIVGAYNLLRAEHANNITRWHGIEEVLWDNWYWVYTTGSSAEKKAGLWFLGDHATSAPIITMTKATIFRYMDEDALFLGPVMPPTIPQAARKLEHVEDANTSRKLERGDSVRMSGKSYLKQIEVPKGRLVPYGGFENYVFYPDV